MRMHGHAAHDDMRYVPPELLERWRARDPIDPYAAENPAEFFAVVSEVFFADALLLRREYPDVYAQLAALYRQDPAQRAERLP